jgi:dephospho-CoA kinase
MKVIGLTGGIGSGKSTLLKWFQMKGVPCFESDAVGRELLNSSLRDSVILRFGEDIYFDGILDRKKMAKKVFGDKKALADLNKIVHPAVNEAFNNFIEKNQNAPFIINESAIIFETGKYKDFYKVILVISPKNVRINRIILRDNVNKENVLSRMKHQLSDSKKIKLADFIIENITLNKFYLQAAEILQKLKK